MLYVSTRSRTDSFTAHRALHEATAADGGAFLPIRIPEYTQEEILQLKDLSFSEAVARQLSKFFSVNITGWDVEFSIGKNPYSLITFGRKIHMGRLWHNEKLHADYVLGRLYALVCNYTYTGKIPEGWAALSIRIALLFGFASELMRQGLDQFDVAVCGDDFDSVFAAWYARKMGLPIGNIIASCNRGAEIWDLIHKGEAVAPALRNYPGVEKLIYSTLGAEENQRYLACKGVYKVDPLKLSDFNKAMYAAVVGDNRVSAAIGSIYKTDRILVDPEIAVCYSALQDHRTKTGESRPTFMLSTQSPALCKQAILAATGLQASEFAKLAEMA